MPEVTITINSREHKIACQDGEQERVRELAEILNNELLKIVENVGQIGDVKLMVLAAITVLDKNQDLLDETTNNIESNIKKLKEIYELINKQV